MDETKTQIKRPEYIFGIILLLALLGFLTILYVNKNSHEEVTDLKVSEIDMKYDLEITDDEKNFYINGWCIKPGETIQMFDISIILWDPESERGFQYSTVFNSRPDVTEAIADGKNYDNSGFAATIKKSTLENKKYEIFLLYRNDENDITVSTGRKIGE